MHIGRKFTLFQTIKWTYKSILIFISISLIAIIPYELLNFKWLSIPWQPITLIGIAVAFTVAFKNNSAYDRLWEARKIWGDIVNESRTWGTLAMEYPKVDNTILVNRHLAWITALRFELRKIKPWEHVDSESKKKRKFFDIDGSKD